MSLISKCTQCGGTSDETIGLCAACRQKTTPPSTAAQQVAKLEAAINLIVELCKPCSHASSKFFCSGNCTREEIIKALDAHATQRAGEVCACCREQGRCNWGGCRCRAPQEKA